ncbi:MULTISPECIES: hypothetical protein [Subtercola]|uniref:Uncharacterized protein n=1 Tax=Subtercola vilae TaxID=2056433 RepID=A0A4T2C2U1_9MICO|nr:MULTISPECIES: hypothetical protein [Subtercola]MEA9984174.1 hypothetical protein [Subtercola sp. RTI3]TIH37441.1 hypothetical protein D4765_08540 [Subtercola vilae]
MRQLHYGAGVITVSFAVCSAVFDYTVALANAGRTERITVPVLVDGERGFSNLLLGPTTQLYCTSPDSAAVSAADSTVDLDDAELIETLARKTAELAENPPLVASNHELDIETIDLD